MAILLLLHRCTAKIQLLLDSDFANALISIRGKSIEVNHKSKLVIQLVAPAEQKQVA